MKCFSSKDKILSVVSFWDLMLGPLLMLSFLGSALDMRWSIWRCNWPKPAPYQPSGRAALNGPWPERKQTVTLVRPFTTMIWPWSSGLAEREKLTKYMISSDFRNGMKLQSKHTQIKIKATPYNALPGSPIHSWGTGAPEFQLWFFIHAGGLQGEASIFNSRPPICALGKRRKQNIYNNITQTETFQHCRRWERQQWLRWETVWGYFLSV